MLRWVLLLALLANALLFFWYAQSYRFADDGRRADINPEMLRTPAELAPGEALEARPRECGFYQPLATETEASRLVDLLKRYSIQAEYRALPPERVGWRLELPLPADSAARIRILDELALQGWVPESREGALVLGSYEQQAELRAVQQSLPNSLAERTRIREIEASSGTYEVSLSYLQGFEISTEIKQLIASGWPGVEFQKNRCEGVASTGVDQ